MKLDTEEWKDRRIEAKMFVKACLTKTPFVRLVPKEAKQQPWIKNIKMDESPPHGLMKKQCSTPDEEEHRKSQIDYTVFSPPPKRLSSSRFFN